MHLASVTVRRGPGGSDRSDVHRARGAGPLRVMCPRRAGKAAWVVTSSLGGGLVDGDQVALEVDVGPGATCLITTQASSKVYRGASAQRLTVRVHSDAAVLVVPDPVVPYREACFTQHTAGCARITSASRAIAAPPSSTSRNAASSASSDE